MQPGPAMLRHWIDRATDRDPTKPWLIAADGDGSVSYGQFRDITRRIGTALVRRGLGRNDRVALLSNNSIEHLLCYFGAMSVGVTICTVHVEMNRNQLNDIFDRLQPKFILFEETLPLDDLLASVAAPKLPLGRWNANIPGSFFAEIAQSEAAANPPSDADPRDDAVILFTSGTSTRPKGVILNYREHLLNIDPTADGFGVTAGDRVYDFRSFNWASAQLLGALVPVNRGATLVMAKKFSASRFFAHVQEHRVTVAAGNPTTINILLNSHADVDRKDIPSLRFLTSSSAPLTTQEWLRFEQKFGVPIAQGYGSSETGWMAAIPGEQRRIGTVGRPFPYHKLSIVDLDGSLAATGMGQIELGGFPDHEYRSLSEDGRVIVNYRGRIQTGDLGTIDEDGFLRVTGRAKDLIIRGGVNISPLEIDSFLMGHPSLIEVATVGVPDAIYGEEVVSYVVPRPGATIDPSSLLRFCNEGLPQFKAPKSIVLTTDLPKTERGKLDRRALVARWSQQTGTETA